MSYAERIIKGSSIIFLMYLAGGIISYILRLFIARNLSVEEFGLLYAILSFVGFLTLFRDLGFGSTLTKFIAEFAARKKLDEIKASIIIVVGVEVVAGIIIAAVVFALADFLSINYFRAAASLPLKIIAASFAISGFIAMQYVFQGLEKIRHYAVIEPVRTGLTLAAAVPLIGLGITGVAYAYLFAAIATSILIFGMVTRVFPFMSVKSRVSKKLAKRLVMFSFPVFFTAVGGTVLVYTDTLLITLFLSVSDVGLYQAALPTSQLLWVLVGSVSVVLLPMVSSLYAKKEYKSLENIVSLTTKFSFIAIMPFIIIIMAFPDLVISLLFGGAYLAAAPALQVLALTSLFYALFAIASSSLLGVGRPEVNMKIVSVIAVVDVVLNIIFIPVLGITGAALTTLLSYIIGTLLSIKYLRQSIKFRLRWHDMLKAFIGGVITLGLFMLMKRTLEMNPWVEFIATSIVGIGFYLVFIYTTKAITKEEIKSLTRAGMPIKFLSRLVDRL
ncbi:flippase [Candidatus Woesearchaeota archaeon]|nr:flippase [Candidatus Woesearchaeota archaeon]